jgi:hypothetical protein
MGFWAGPTPHVAARRIGALYVLIAPAAATRAADLDFQGERLPATLCRLARQAQLSSGRPRSEKHPMLMTPKPKMLLARCLATYVGVLALAGAPASGAEPTAPAAAKAQEKAQKVASKKNPGKAHALACPAHVPEAVDPPEGLTIEQGLAANGVQVYVCTASKGGTAPSWQLEGPHAVLSAGQQVVGIHFAGPTWQALDGSSIKASKVASAEAPEADAVPWLLLSGTPTGQGAFALVTHIQRLETAGGKAPDGGCDAGHVGAKVLVPYTSSYFLYRPAAAGEAVRQCRSPAAKKKAS